MVVAQIIYAWSGFGRVLLFIRKRTHCFGVWNGGGRGLRRERSWRGESGWYTGARGEGARPRAEPGWGCHLGKEYKYCKSTLPIIDNSSVYLI